LELTEFPSKELKLPEINESNLFDLYSFMMEERLKSNQLGMLLPILDWIKERAKQVKIGRISLTHGDFHPDNILVNEKGKFIVLDWSAVMPVDFRYDLAWTMVLTRLYASEELKDAIYYYYQKELGKSIENIKIFEVIALLRRLSDIAVILTQGSINTGMRNELTYIIRSEKELIIKLQDLLFQYTKIKVEIPLE
jgi:thiamine kinase-like enzyme